MVISDAILDQSGHIFETQHVNLRRGYVSLSGSRSRSMSDYLVTEASDEEHDEEEEEEEELVQEHEPTCFLVNFS